MKERRSNRSPSYRRDLKDRARRLRRRPTSAERLLWSRLRRKQLGVRFLQQRPVGAHIVDFFCPAYRLAVEIDGMSHDGRRADDRRDVRFDTLGIRTLRYTNEAVLFDLDAVVRCIQQAIAAEGA